MDRTHVIVGGGLAGATAALTLRAQGLDGRVIVVCGERRPPYSRPPLSKSVVRGEIAPERTELRPRQVWDDKQIELELGRTAVALSPAAHELTLEDGERLRYDKLLLATGGTAGVLAGTEGIPGVHTLRTIEDAVTIRGLLGPERSLAIVGAGFIGAELAASAVMAGTRVTLFEVAPAPLSRVLPPVLGRRFTQLHRERTVDVRVGSGVRMITPGPGGLRLDDSRGGVVTVDAVVVAIGMVPDVALAAGAGLATGNGVIVDEFCQSSAPDIYAAGDIACHPNRFLGRRVRIEHWQNAQHQGAAAARSMLGSREPFTEVPWVWSDQYDVNLQITGIPEPGDEVIVRGDLESLHATAYLLRDGRLAAAAGLNRAEDVRVARRLIAAGVSPPRETLADPDLDLAAIAPAA